MLILNLPRKTFALPDWEKDEGHWSSWLDLELTNKKQSRKEFNCTIP
jgi:hypothetical protein